ncbi:MAG TPA: sodium-dependent bicarbonate transport family permease [Polaromonas sp.]|uniref:sodium-dependent bicarbonate transport family permease n=1 Tax=Polaromonas sp. TaxID=1869339 RepID=UPI002D5EA132|nr:sodium-dependent bicarbonate transport family permease [Polaromonas sp.]HYW56556.1 sodium-dependent bicarbonate transport family permease [Polaromonas sp.]
MSVFEPVILFFVLGALAGFVRSDLKIPGVLYESLSIFLLLAIGLKGGVELARYSLPELAVPALVVVGVGALIPLVAYPVLRRLGRLGRADAGSIAAHYGSVSVVTFAVGAAYLARLGEVAEGYMVVFLVLLEFPALVIGVLLARRGESNTPWKQVLHEVFAGKSIILLVGGLVIGWVAGAGGIAPLDRLFFDLFKGVLAFFLLEMGLVVARRFGEPRRAGIFLIAFAVFMPLLAAGLGLLTGWWLGLSVGGLTLLATLYASASYIAAPAAMRIAVPQANPALSIGAALGITFPFNLIVGIPLYHRLAQSLPPLGV